MIDTDLWFLPEVTGNTPQDMFVVRGEGRNVMGSKFAPRIPSVVPKVVEDEIESLFEQ